VTATDLSGNGNTGVLVNEPTWTTGRLGSALSFDGVDDYVEIAHSDSLNLTTELTVSAWVYNHGTYDPLLQDSEYHIIAAKGWAGDAGGSWTLAWDKKTNALLFFVRKNLDNGYHYVSVDYGTLTTDWHLITAVFNKGKISLYIDGSLAAGPVTLGTTRIRANTEDVSIGALLSNQNSRFHSWDGYIDDVQIYDVALGDAEIATLFEIFESGYNPSAQFTSASLTVNPPWNYSLSNSGDKSVTQGSSTTNTITATLSSGSSQSVSFFASGLPSGASASFSSNSCTPTCSSTLTLATNSSTPSGYYPYPITVTATGGGLTRTTTFNLTVNLLTLPTVATPTITPNGGSYTGSVSVTLQTATSGASIYYTTNGSTPSQSSTLYTGALTLTSSAVVKAVAFKSGSNPSAMASASFTIVSGSKLTMTWQDNSSNEDNFRIERKTGTGGTYSQIATVAANSTSYVDTTVTNGVTYCYRLRAVNSSAASSYSNEACATAHF